MDRLITQSLILGRVYPSPTPTIGSSPQSPKILRSSSLVMLSKIRKSLPENYAKYIKITTKIFQIHSKSSLEAFLGRLVTENWEWGSPRPARPRIWDPLEAPKYNRNQSNAAKTVPKLIKKENSKIMWFPRTFFNWFLKVFDFKIHRFLNLFSISFSIERQKVIL